MDDGINDLTIPSWYELPSNVRGAWENRIELLVPAPPLLTEMTGPGFTLDKFDPKTLAQTVGHDALLVGRLLAVANSAMFGQSKQVTSVERAIVLLGFNMVKAIIVGFLMDYELGEELKLPDEHVEFVRHWTGGAAVVAHQTAANAGLADPALVATAALLSRIGALLFGVAGLPPDNAYGKMGSEWERLAYEMATWQVSAPALSAELLNEWVLPDPLPDLAQYSWLPVVRPLPATMEKERALTLSIIAAGLALADRYLHDNETTPAALLAEPDYRQLAANLQATGALAALNTAWQSARVKRELLGIAAS
ncbi:HDOD domain-containing protein [bacterium]|nr:HDOD domain-containing protein [bacterium]